MDTTGTGDALALFALVADFLDTESDEFDDAVQGVNLAHRLTELSSDALAKVIALTATCQALALAEAERRTG